MQYVFIDPDGTHSEYLYVIVASNTGVIYANQCEGYLTSEKSMEGFLIPLNGNIDSKPLIEFFSRFKGYPPGTKDMKWKIDDLKKLEEIVSRIPIWRTSADLDEEDSKTFLKLDYENIEDGTEAWVPVITPYGKGILVFENCD